MAVVSKQSFTRATKKSGPLVKVEISPGHVVKMYKEDAIAEGYLPPEIKAIPPAENKMMPRSENKAAGEQGSGRAGEIKQAETKTGPDDFTTIPGVGRATARALQARGVTTFEQLRQAGALDYVSEAAMKAIEAWRNG